MGASGAQNHKGLPADSCKGVHPQIFQACANGESFNTELFRQLHTDIDLNGLFEILDMQEMQDSWRHAMMKNNVEN